MRSITRRVTTVISITGEIRHGTIRPTFLITPERRRVVAAKVAASILIGAGFGLIAVLIAGRAVAAALCAAIGAGIGAAVRHQVPALVGITAWLLFVENLLAGVGDIGRLLPGSAGRAVSGQNPDVLPARAVALVLLRLYAAAAALAGSLATSRGDAARVDRGGAPGRH